MVEDIRHYFEEEVRTDPEQADPPDSASFGFVLATTSSASGSDLLADLYFVRLENEHSETADIRNWEASSAFGQLPSEVRGNRRTEGSLRVEEGAVQHLGASEVIGT